MASNWSWQCSRGHEAPDKAETCPVCGDTDLDWRSTGTAKEWDVGALLYIVLGLGLVAAGLGMWVSAVDGTWWCSAACFSQAASSPGRSAQSPRASGCPAPTEHGVSS